MLWGDVEVGGGRNGQMGFLIGSRLSHGAMQCAATSYWVPFLDGEEWMNDMSAIHLFIHFILPYSTQLRFIYFCTVWWIEKFSDINCNEEYHISINIGIFVP